MELVSIVIPVYNGEKYIEDCVKYLRNQTYQNIEVFFVNDGSTDRSLSICKQIVKKDERFRLISQENGGTARARNAGLDEAKGAYIIFLDVDDEYHPKMIETLVSVIEKKHTDMAVCGYRIKVEGSEKGQDYLENKTWRASVYYSLKDIKNDYIDIWDAEMLSYVWHKLYRMGTIRKYGIRFRDGHVYTEDRVFNRLFLSKTRSIAFIECCLYDYVRERVGSTTEKYREDAFDIRYKEYHEFQQHFRELGVWDEKAREYTSREFIERIAGCVENVFHAEAQLTMKQKYERIKVLIAHPDVRKALQYAKCRSIKMRIIVLPIRLQWTFGTYLIGWTVYLIRKRNPVLFYWMKGRR